MEFFEADLGEVTLYCAAAGEKDAPLVVCLHGFPEFWVAWSGVMDGLADAFRVVAPDQRGYNLSSKPEGVDAYRAAKMVADLDALAGQLSPGRPFVLAGHDWGASVGYAYALARPERLSALVIANGVHPAAFQRAIFDDPDQRAASQYIEWLRAPGSETLLAEDGYRRLLNMLEGFSRTEWMTPALRTGYLEAWSRPGAMRAMVDWYRASPIMVPSPGEPPGASKVLAMPDEALTVRVPHLVIWGEEDAALRPSCLDGLARYAPDLSVVRVPDAGHWLLHEKAEEVARIIRGYLARR